MFTGLAEAKRSLRTDERGSVAIIFALMSFALVFLSGMAIDYGRIQDLRTRLTDAVDAASLAAGRAVLDGNLSDEEVIELAKAYFVQNSKTSAHMTSIGDPEITLDRETGKVDISVQSQIGMTLARIGGFDSMNVPVASTATFQQRDIEVGMALDITGSMKDPIGGKRKIDSLKAAFKDFTKELFPENAANSQRVRVALAPYSGSVKLGDYASVATSGKSKDGCVTESKNATPTDAAGLFFSKDDSLKDVDPTGGLDNAYDCPNGKPSITPLMADKVTLDDIVDGYQTSGSTGGHFGAQWAWNLVSDKWAGAFGGDSAPASYQEVEKGKLMKAVVLLTDGDFNTAFHGKASAEQAVALCAAMRTAGVTVFAVGFGLKEGSKADATLRACATPGNGYFANAGNEEELSQVFQSFAAKLSQLRLSN